MTQLSVNINKIATLRNARGGQLPSVTQAAIAIQSFGAHGITVHPRPDERHITKKDVFEIKPLITTEFNMEGYPSEDFIQLVQQVRPDQVTLVPDPPEAITSNAGWKILKNEKLLSTIFKSLADFRISVFVEPATCSTDDLKCLKNIGAQRIELYTEDFAKAFEHQNDLGSVLKKYIQLSEKALSLGLGLNAGHDLNQKNLATFITAIPEISEVSIGHALISEALYEGLETTVSKYLKILKSQEK